MHRTTLVLGFQWELNIVLFIKGKKNLNLSATKAVKICKHLQENSLDTNDKPKNMGIAWSILIETMLFLELMRKYNKTLLLIIIEHILEVKIVDI